MYFDYNKYRHFYTADFETSTQAWGVDVARVWLWDICDENLVHIQGNSLYSFICEISKSKYNNTLFSFHNLAYDGCYILDYLLRNGYKYCDKKNLKPLEFSAIITPQGTHYAYEICFENNIIVTINDSYKHNSMGVSKLAKTYKLPILKEEIDYNVVRDEKHKPTEQEIKYIKHDTEIVMRVLKEDIKHGFNKFTESGNSRKFLKKYLSKDYNVYMPVLDDFEDDFVRRAYRGGYVYLNSKYFNKELNKMMSLDINSMYPSMMLHRKMPIGQGYHYTGFKEDYKELNKYECYVQHFKACFRLKENRPPTIARKSFNGFNNKELYLTSSGFKHCELWLTNVDLKLFFECYKVWDLEYIDFICYDSICGVEITEENARTMSHDEIIKEDGKGSIFYDYIYPNRYEKEHEEGGRRERAKKLQNIAYGAQATSKSGKLAEPILFNNHLAYKKYESEKRKGGYIPIATFITAYSRELLILNIIKNWDRFVYCDTDSLYLLGQENPDIPIHETLYGYFKIEHYIEKAKFLGCKRYICLCRKPNETHYKLKVTCCGAPDGVKEQMNLDNFVPYNKETGEGVFNGKLSAHILCGGKHLIETTYKLIC